MQSVEGQGIIRLVYTPILKRRSHADSDDTHGTVVRAGAGKRRAAGDDLSGRREHAPADSEGTRSGDDRSRSRRVEKGRCGAVHAGGRAICRSQGVAAARGSRSDAGRQLREPGAVVPEDAGARTGGSVQPERTRVQAGYARGAGFRAGLDGAFPDKKRV